MLDNFILSTIRASLDLRAQGINGGGDIIVMQHVDTIVANAVEELQTKLKRISDWCKAYPLEVFPAPDWDMVKELLGDTLLTQVSAANMRHVVTGIQKIIEE